MKTISREYLLLFNAITDTEAALQRLREDLMNVQQQAESVFLDEEEVGTDRRAS